MIFESWIAYRYLKSQSLGRYARLLTFTAIASVAIGMASLIIVMSVMRGFRQELADHLLGFNSHITFVKSFDASPLGYDEIQTLMDNTDVRDISPFVQGEVIAISRSSGSELALGSRVRGIDPTKLGNINKVEFYFPETESGLDSALLSDSSKVSKAIVGNEIVYSLTVHPDFGDTIELVAPLAVITPSGELGPNSRRFKVSGVFKTGIYDYDNKYILTSYEAARSLLGEQAQEGWFVRLKDPTTVPGVIASLKGKLPIGWEVKGLDEQNKKLFAALKLERLAMGGVFLMVVLIASFAIVGVVLLVTASKRKDIAILKSFGLSDKNIGRVFLVHSIFIGATGCGIGIALATIVTLTLQKWQVRLPSTYYLDFLPVDISLTQSALYALGGILIAILSSLYPVRQAMSQKIAEVLRYE